MKLGFTGTQRGMTLGQLDKVSQYLTTHWPTEVHHGDCVGADAEFHDMVCRSDIAIHIHPPEDPRKQANCQGITYAPKPYLQRNRDIVDQTDQLLATPDGPERLRSGTWSTVRYAITQSKRVTIVHPDGTVEVR